MAVLSVSLKAPSVNVRSNDFIVDSITRWDRTREESGQGQWDFAFHISHPGGCIIRLRDSFTLWHGEDSFRSAEKGTGPLSPSRARRHEVKPNIQHLQNVRIPTFALSTRPRPTSNRRERRRDLSHGEKIADADDNDALEDWNERASSLFEWVGMVNIGAQRYASL